MKSTSLRFKTLASALLLAATAGLALPTYAAGPGMPMDGGMGMGMGMEHGGMMGGAGMRPGAHMDRMLTEIKATPEQRAQITTIMNAAQTDLRTQADAGRAMHLQMQQLLSQPVLDANAIETQRQQMSAHHDQVSKRMTQALLDGARVLSPDQRKLLADRMAQRRGMMERHRQERDTLDKPKS
jgi:Spy/CpxP family protein refolding chaperone